LAPAEYAKRYLSYDVKVGAPPRVVTVKLKSLKYRNAQRENFTKTSPEMLAKDAVQGKGGPGWTQAIQSAFMGKGSPEGIARVLELVAQHDLWAFGDPAWGNDLKKQSIPIEDKLEKYCDRMIGLDCLGFVINYVQSQKTPRPSVSPLSADMPHFRTPPFLPRATILNIRTGDVVVWDEPPRHIAMIGSTGWDLGSVGKFPFVMAAADTNFGPAGLVMANFGLRPAGQAGTYTFVGKFHSQAVRIFGTDPPWF
jgi:hypothetical protein